jgi:tellurite resistance protein TerC
VSPNRFDLQENLVSLPSPSALLVAASDTADENFASFDVPPWVWLTLVAAIALMLVFDLLAVHRTAHVISAKEAAIESAVWISIGLCSAS